MRALLLLLVLMAPLQAVAEPESVPRLTDRHLDATGYAELARQWQAQIEQGGETVRAWVNLGRAHFYLEEAEAALRASRRAVELGPDDPDALLLLGKVLATRGEREAEALEVLEHCRAVAPDHQPALNMLATVHLRLGQLDEADRVFRSVFERNLLDRPLQDYAYNMLVGLPEGAVLVTGGDNDSYPAWALQAGMHFRDDVLVVNRSLFNLPAYVDGVFARRPELRPDFAVEEFTPHYEGDQLRLLSDALVGKMVEEGKAPVHLAATVNPELLALGPHRVFEGITLRTSSEGLSANETAELVLNRYRLDSCTDWSFPWELKTTVRTMMRNYVACMARLVTAEGLSTKNRERLYDRATQIAEFHGFERMLTNLKLQRGRE